MKKEYNIGFTLGDPSGDGHSQTIDYHIVTNYSANDITKAYKRASEYLGFDFVKEVGSEYLADRWICQEVTEKLLEFKIIHKDGIVREEASWGPPIGCYDMDYAEEEFVNIFFGIVKIIIPDFEWKERDLEEEWLPILDGAAYGFIGN